MAVSSATPYTDARSGHAGLGTQLVGGPHFQLWHVSDMDDVPALPPSGKVWIIPLSGQVQIGGGAAGKGECIVASDKAHINFSRDATTLVAFWSLDALGGVASHPPRINL